MRRKEQWTYPRRLRDQELLGWGHEAAHYGSVETDALRLGEVPSEEQSRWFEMNYGVSKDVYEKYKGAHNFADVLDCHFGMIQLLAFRRRHHTRKANFTSIF